MPAVCGAAVVRMERGCHSDRCRGRDFSIVRWLHIVVIVRIVTLVTIHRRRQKLGRKTKQQMRRHRQFYSRWSRWSPCTQLCQTTRTKVCKVSARADLYVLMLCVSLLDSSNNETKE